MKKNTSPMEPDMFYHIFNRGINGENLFKEERNYNYFLGKYAKNISPVADTYAYCMLKNHFHLAIKVKSETELLNYYALKKNIDIEILHAKKATDPESISKLVEKIINQQFAVLFNTFAQAINKAHKRTGGLFEASFRRIPVKTDEYLRTLIKYIHKNPQYHKFTPDFRTYVHSSYHSFLGTLPTQLKKQEVFELFDGRPNFIVFHEGIDNKGITDAIKIEVD